MVAVVYKHFVPGALVRQTSVCRWFSRRPFSASALPAGRSPPADDPHK